MYSLAHYAARRAPTYSRRNDWGEALARTQAMAQNNNTVDQQLETLGAAVIQFVDSTRVQMEAMRARVAALRPAANDADAAYESIEIEFWGEDDVPPEITEIIENTPTGFGDFLDEMENKLDELF